jgi:tungstate transport system ATP-binding protein
MVFQRPVMFRRSALGNLRFALAIAGVPASERDRRARDALERVGLVTISHQPARVLSGGEQQRLALARAWMLEPEVLFLDEPTANLDPGATREIERIVGAIHAAGTKIVMVTHNLGQAQRLADEILFLHDGRLAERTAAADFFRKPATAEAAAYLEGELPWRIHAA